MRSVLHKFYRESVTLNKRTVRLSTSGQGDSRNKHHILTACKTTSVTLLTDRPGEGSGIPSWTSGFRALDFSDNDACSVNVSRPTRHASVLGRSQPPVTQTKGSDQTRGHEYMSALRQPSSPASASTPYVYASESVHALSSCAATRLLTVLASCLVGQWPLETASKSQGPARADLVNNPREGLVPARVAVSAHARTTCRCLVGRGAVGVWVPKPTCAPPAPLARSRPRPGVPPRRSHA